MNTQIPNSDMQALRRLVPSNAAEKNPAAETAPVKSAAPAASKAQPAAGGSDMAALRRLVQSQAAASAEPAEKKQAQKKTGAKPASPQPPQAAAAAPAAEEKAPAAEEKAPAVSGGSDMAALRRLVKGYAAPAAAPVEKKPVAAAPAASPTPAPATNPAPAPASDLEALRRLIPGHAVAAPPAKAKAKNAPEKAAPAAVELQAIAAPIPAPPVAAPVVALAPTAPASDLEALRRLIPHEEESAAKAAPAPEKTPEKTKTAIKNTPEQVPAVPAETMNAAAAPQTVAEALPAPKSDLEALRRLIPHAEEEDAAPADMQPAAEEIPAAIAAPAPAEETPAVVTAPAPEAPSSDLATLRRLIPHEEESAAQRTAPSRAKTRAEKRAKQAPIPAAAPSVSTPVQASMAQPAAGASDMTDLPRLLPAGSSAAQEAFAPEIDMSYEIAHGGSEIFHGGGEREVIQRSGEREVIQRSGAAMAFNGGPAFAAGQAGSFAAGMHLNFGGVMPAVSIHAVIRLLGSLVICVPAMMLSLMLMETPFSLPEPPMLAIGILVLAALNIVVLAALDSYRDYLGDLTILSLLGFIAMVMLYVMTATCDRFIGTRGYEWLTPVTIVMLAVCYGSVFRERVVPLKLFLSFNGLALTVLWCLGAADKMALPF